MKPSDIQKGMYEKQDQQEQMEQLDQIISDKPQKQELGANPQDIELGISNSHQDVEKGEAQLKAQGNNIEFDNQNFHKDDKDQLMYQQDGEYFQPIPKKYIGIVLFLLVTGSILFLIGLIDYLTESKPNKQQDISFIVTGGILLIPGLFYGYKLVQAIFALSNDDRQDVLSDFPLDPD